MKRLLAYLLFLVAAGSSRAQCPTGPAQLITAFYEYKFTKFRDYLQIPRHAPGAPCRDTANVYYNVADSAIHWWTGFTDRSFLQHANQGLYDSNYTVQLGEPANQAGNPARLNQAREVPLNGKSFTWWDTANNVLGGRLVQNDTAHSTLVSPYKVQVRQFADSNSSAAYMWNAWYPRNYGYLYPGGKPNGAPMKSMGWSWGYSENSSGGLPAPDIVFGGGYNVLNATAKNDTGDAALSLRVESNFIVNGEPNFEMHWPELFRFDGTMQRVNSWYMGKTTGTTLWESNLDRHDYKRAVGTNPGGLWAQLTSNSGDFGTLSLYGTHNNSIAGVVNFIDSSGKSYSFRGEAGSLDLVTSLKAQVGVFGIDGSMWFNQNQGLAPANGTTIIGQNDDGTLPANVFRGQLAVCSQSRGLLIPQMSTAQKNAIASAGDGVLVMDLDQHRFNFSSNSTWITVPAIYKASFSQVGAATTTFTVTIGPTLPSATYQVNVTPTAALSAAAFYVTNKTTTTFDVVYLAGLTGTVTFDWVLAQ